MLAMIERLVDKLAGEDQVTHHTWGVSRLVGTEEGRMAPDPELLDEVVRRIVEVADPEKIILFGSAARGEMNRHSDLDVLVIKRGMHRRRLAGRIHRNLRDLGAAVDVVVATPEDMDRYGDVHAFVLKPALLEGSVVYDTA